MEIIGKRAVMATLSDNIKAKRLIVQDLNSRNLKDIIELAQEKGLEIREDPMFFGKFERSHQGVCLVIPDYDYKELEDFLELDISEREIILALDSIQDVNNLGSIIRSASVFGVKGIIIPKDRSADVSPAVVKTAQGGLNDVSIMKVTNLARTLRQLKDSGYFVVGCHMEGDGIEEIISPPVVIVIGSEHSGIRPGVLKECDKLVTIPMSEKSSVGCLNAGVATSIILYEYFKTFGV